MKALYLNGLQGVEVMLDGPALRVRRPGRVDGRYPLSRVARVVVVGTVHWRPNAWAACLREHKPVAVLDGAGRFVRVIFRTPPKQIGLARHLGELLRVARFRSRYERWFRATERAEMRTAASQIDLPCGDLPPKHFWQAICLEQHWRWRTRVGWYHRYLIGLAAAQIASTFALLGMPRDPGAWEREEYRLFCDTVRLERWREAMLLESELARHRGLPVRRDLTAAFEHMADERERRIAAWRQRALLEMMCAPLGQQNLAGCEQPDRIRRPLQMSADLSPISTAARTRLGTNYQCILAETPESLRTSVRVLLAYLEQDRRACESYRTA